MAAFLLLLLPALAVAHINVEVIGQYDEDASNMKVYFSGSESDIISNEERKAFDLNDAKLKEAVRAYFGAYPDDAFLRSPTPWGDLYQSYGWGEVLRSLVPKSARILNMSTEPTIVMEQIFENNSSKPGLFNVAIHQELENTVSSSWTQSHELKIDHEINYDFEILFINGKGKNSISYTGKYGEDYKKSKTVTVGSTSAMNVLLQPGQGAVATLHATRGRIMVEIDYEASLNGNVAVNYNTPFKGHHFWSLDVRGVMDSGRLNNMVKSKEVLEIGFYVTSKVVVKDREMGLKMMELEL